MAFHEAYNSIFIDEYDYKNIAAMITPSVISVGVLIAWITLNNNIKDKNIEIEIEKSAFFFQECLLRFNKVERIFDSRKNLGENSMYGFSSPINKEDVNNILNHLLIADKLDKNIINEDYLFAYQSRKKDLEAEFLKVFIKMNIVDLTGIHWEKSSLSIEEKIDSWNKFVREKKEEKDISFLKDVSATVVDGSTPFPDGMSKMVLLKIASFFSSGDDNVIEYLNNNKLDVVLVYFDMCEKYECVEREFIMRPGF